MNLPKPLPSALSWDWLGAFRAVEKTGSLSAAARLLGAAQPTVRRQVEALERALGVVLFTRSPTGLAPTEAARAILPFAESMAASADALVRHASAPATSTSGTVRVTASEVVGIEVLPAIFADLLRAHPLLHIELSPTNQSLDMLRRDADVAVRMTQPTQGALVAKRVADVALGLFATDDYLAERGTPRTLAELSHGHALIGRDRDGAAFYEAFARAGLRVRPRHFAFRSDSDIAQHNAIRAGLGVGILQLPLAARNEELRRVLPKLELTLPMWVVTHEDLRTTPRVAAVFEGLVKGLGRYAKGKG
jgi:DNA-binding transcriptional LysR family regulator